jgi:hypothetical protein
LEAGYNASPTSIIIIVVVVITGSASNPLKRLVAAFPPRRPGFDPGSGQVEFVVDKVAMDGFSPSSSVSLTNLHSAKFSIIIITRGSLQ